MSRELRTSVRPCGFCNQYSIATNGITIDRDNEIITLEEYCMDCNNVNIVKFKIYSTEVHDPDGLTIVPEEITENWRYATLNGAREPNLVKYCPNCRRRSDDSEETLTPGPDGCVITWECKSCGVKLTINIPKREI